MCGEKNRVLTCLIVAGAILLAFGAAAGALAQGEPAVPGPKETLAVDLGGGVKMEFERFMTMAVPASPIWTTAPT